VHSDAYKAVMQQQLGGAMRAKSDNLFHFTKTLEVLKLILKNGFNPRFCLEDQRLMSWYGQEYLAFPMVCFCDIPLSRIMDHVGSYGEYGLGLERNWGLDKGLSPVIYTPQNSQVYNLAQSLSQRMLFSDIENPQDEEDCKNLLSLIKPVSGNMKVSGENIYKDFYQENEWRFVPPTTMSIPENQYEELIDSANELMIKHSLKFLTSDIKYIFVKDESEVVDLVEFIEDFFSHCSKAERTILVTKIIVLDELRVDI
jgi:hypothetical protein